MPVKLAQYQLRGFAHNAGLEIIQAWGTSDPACPIQIWGVPRGGVPAAYLIAAAHPGRFHVVDKEEEAFAIVDDVVDSGITRSRWSASGKPFVALIDKSVAGPYQGEWLEFPWEESEEKGIEDHIIRLLEFVGEDASREGLKETPARVAKAWKHWCSGYGKKPEDILKVFTDGAKGVDEMVVIRDIPLYSTCEHHLAAIFGTATVAYIPNGKIVGLSKINRLVDLFARRLQVQERLTNQIADALVEHLQPLGVGVIIKARHLCMESRGVCQQGHHTITSALRGVIKGKPEARAEFMGLLQ